jgi:hypothetical protein
MCPNGYAAGCRCSDCFGFAEYMFEATGKTYPGLPEAPDGLRTLRGEPASGTIEPEARVVELPCRSMTCQCDRCQAARAQRPVERVRQPWEPKPARARAA